MSTTLTGRLPSFRRPGITAVPRALPFVLVAATILLDVALQPALLSREQLGTQVANALTLIIISLGQTVVVLSRGIDLSVGGMMSLCNCLLALHGGTSAGSVAMWSVIVIALGAGFGATNGLLIMATRIQPFVVTLATWSVFSGIALWILPVPGGTVAPSLVELPLRNLGGLPVPVWILAGLIVLWLYLRATPLAAKVYGLGSSPESAALRGVSRWTTIVYVYAFSGACAGLAAVFVSAQTASGSPTAGNEFVLLSVAAVVIGGTSLAGGRGGFIGSAAGAIQLTLLADVTFNLGVDGNWSVLVGGALLIFAVAVSSYANRRIGRSQ